jgi:hypothetical protein
MMATFIEAPELLQGIDIPGDFRALVSNDYDCLLIQCVCVSVTDINSMQYMF